MRPGSPRRKSRQIRGLRPSRPRERPTTGRSGRATRRRGAPRARVRGATGGRRRAQEVGDVGTRRAIEGSRPSARDRDARLHGRLTELEAARLSQVLLTGGSGAGGRAFRGGDLRFREPHHRTGRASRVRGPQERTGEVLGEIRAGREAVRDHSPPDDAADEERKGLWRMSRREHTRRERSKTLKRNSLRPEKRAGATPKSYKEPWKASTGSPTRHAGSGRA